MYYILLYIYLYIKTVRANLFERGGGRIWQINQENRAWVSPVKRSNLNYVCGPVDLAAEAEGGACKVCRAGLSSWRGRGEAFKQTSIPESIELVFLRIGGTCHIPLESHKVRRAGWGAQVYGKGKMHRIEMLLAGES